MNKFDDREKSFEKKFQMDQELQFKVQARSNKYLAEFVSLKLGKTEEICAISNDDTKLLMTKYYILSGFLKKEN